MFRLSKKSATLIVTTILLVSILLFIAGGFYYWYMKIQREGAGAVGSYQESLLKDVITEIEVRDGFTTYNSSSKTLTFYIRNTGGRKIPISKSTQTPTTRWMLYDSEKKPICSTDWSGICLTTITSGGASPCGELGEDCVCADTTCNGACNTNLTNITAVSYSCATASDICWDYDPDCAYNPNSDCAKWGNAFCNSSGYACVNGAWVCNATCMSDYNSNWGNYYTTGCGNTTVDGALHLCSNGICDTGELCATDTSAPPDCGGVCAAKCSCPKVGYQGTETAMDLGETRKIEILLARTDCDLEKYGTNKLFYFTIDFSKQATAAGYFTT